MVAYRCRRLKSEIAYALYTRIPDGGVDLILDIDDGHVQHHAVHDSSGHRIVHRIAALANAETYTGGSRNRAG